MKKNKTTRTRTLALNTTRVQGGKWNIRKRPVYNNNDPRDRQTDRWHESRAVATETRTATSAERKRMGNTVHGKKLFATVATVAWRHHRRREQLPLANTDLIHRLSLGNAPTNRPPTRPSPPPARRATCSPAKQATHDPCTESVHMRESRFSTERRSKYQRAPLSTRTSYKGIVGGGKRHRAPAVCAWGQPQLHRGTASVTGGGGGPTEPDTGGDPIMPAKKKAQLLLC